MSGLPEADIVEDFMNTNALKSSGASERWQRELFGAPPFAGNLLKSSSWRSCDANRRSAYKILRIELPNFSDVGAYARYHNFLGTVWM
jgi:hypothetical protein